VTKLSWEPSCVIGNWPCGCTSVTLTDHMDDSSIYNIYSMTMGRSFLLSGKAS
jgi:hypothetical protein